MMPRLCSLLPIALLISFQVAVAQQATNATRQRISMDEGWRFAFGHPSDTKKDFDHGTGYFSYLAKAGYADGAASQKFDDRTWRKLNLPHDWAVEQDVSENGSFSHGFKAIGAKFPDATIGWYRKTWTVPASDLGRRISIEFDGVFRNSKVWVNGHYLGTEASGYNSFTYDITDVLNYGGENVIAVRVDAGMEEGWFYEGAGIYRHVWLSATSPVHVERNGTAVTTKINHTNLSADVSMSAGLMNKGKGPEVISVIQTLLDSSGKAVASSRTDGVTLLPWKSMQVNSNLAVTQVKLWDLDRPYLYHLVTTLESGGKELDRYETEFGFRTVRFDAKQGFFLNEKNIKLKGTNNHQDHAGVGAAIPDELQYYRIKALKAFGSNAYRCSHNPPTPELLEACDRLGMLVIDENRLMGTTDQMLDDLKGMIRRDRNHPSIILWSVGNEEWAIENSITGSRIVATLQAVAKSMDSTRAATAGVSGGFQGGISDVLEVMGYNYIGNGDIDKHHQRFPDQPAAGTEEGSTFATRGIYFRDSLKNYATAYDRKPRPGFYSIEEGWKFYSDRPWLAGMFIWTGFDYRGEPTPYGWPSVTSYFGMMDLCGFPKDNVYYLKSWWSDEPTLHILPHWNWKGKEGQDIDVWTYSNCDEVELFLNKKSLGKKPMTVNSHLEWKVKYAPGTLRAIGYKKGKRILEETVSTTADAASLRLAGHQQTIKADSRDIVVVTVSAQDARQLAVPTADNDISFSITGPGRIIGVGNGDPVSAEKERFIEEITRVSITDLKEKPLQDVSEGKSQIGVDVSGWKDAFKSRDYKNLPVAYIHHGTFVLPADLSGQKITLYFNSVGTSQSVYINGKAVSSELKDNQLAAEITLDSSMVRSGLNSIDIIARPFTKKYEWDVVNTNPGTIQLLKPAGQWQRKLFSGLAQVIVQSTGEPGEIVLTATAAGLKPASLRIRSAKTNGSIAP
ncbi:MAG: glycoside hydrolase family 2 protein [Chitinophagaceae bacterium]|nr:MAG: glycoside hydrolase family 2 protein [Chitinophagaceae bacterium]